MKSIKDVLIDLVPKRGKNQSQVAKQMGISSQLLGQYMAGRQKPKAEFYQKWKDEFGDDLLNIIKTNVSRETAKKGDFDLETAHKEIINYLEDLKNGQTNLWNQGQFVRQEISGVADYLMLKDAEWDPEKMKELKETYYKIVRGVPPASGKMRKLKEDHKSGRG